MRKKTALFFIFLCVSILFNIPSSLNNLTSAEVGEEFNLKDTFEDSQYQNRIYTEYDNYTQEEYFKDYIGDSADFTEDKEGFVAEGGAIDNGLSSGYWELDLPTDWDGIKTPIINLTEYSVLEYRIWSNLTTDYFYIAFRDYTGASIAYKYTLYLTADTWVTHTYIIPSDILDDTRYISFLTHQSQEEYPIKVRFDYVKFWKGNYTDYAFQNGDSWDFGEGDTENVDFSHATETVSTDEELKVTPIGTNSYTYHQNTVDFSYHNHLEVRFITDFQTTGTQDNFVFLRLYDTDGDYLQTVIYDFTDAQPYTITLSQTDYTSEAGDFEINKANYFQVYFKSNVGNLAIDDFIYIDYILLYHDDLENDNTKTNQQTSSYRASKGLYSFVSDVPNNVTYYEGFTTNTNKSIKIDIPSLKYLPTYIRFNYYTTVVFVLYLIIDETYYILYNNSLYKNEWMVIGESIDRSDILINNTDSEIYFEIVLNETYSYEEIFIDELTIKYIEPIYSFEHHLGTVNTLNENQFIMNSTNTVFSAIPSNVAGYAMGLLTEGIRFNSSSNDIFSRRMFMNYYISSNESEVDFTVYQETYIDIDNIYKLVVWVINKQQSSVDYFNRHVDYHVELYKNDVKVSGLTIDDFTYDYALDNYHSINVEISIVQEDYNTISLETVYINTFTGNRTTFQPFSFNINRDENTVHNTLNNVRIVSLVDITPCIDSGFPVVPIECQPKINGQITRDLKHSPVVAPIETGLETGQMPVWDDDHPFLSFFAIVGYYIQQFINFIVNQFKQSGYIKDILTNIIYFFSEQIEAMKNLFIALGDIDNILDLIGVFAGYIFDVLGNVFAYLGTMGQAFIDLIIDMIGDDLIGYPILEEILDAFSAFLGGDWLAFQTAWANIVPELDFETVEKLLFIPNAFLALFIADTTFLTTIVYTFIQISAEFYLWVTILGIMYLVYICQMVIKRDFDRLRIEATTWVNVVNYIINAITFVFHWMFELIHAVLDVTIPFT